MKSESGCWSTKMSELRAVDLEVLDTLEQLQFVAQGQAETWQAHTKTGEPVIVKIFRFEDVLCWKGLELFRREIQVLEQLNHPGIPKYMWHREVEVDDQLHIYLVQERVTGESLANYQLKDTADLDRLIQGVLSVLIYLQNFTPPVVHRDVKPSNIIVSEDRVFLVDFGAVQVVTPSDNGGSTVVGTSGYMPFEQLMGRAVPASDLYGLGMTLIELVTGKTPDLLPMTNMRPIWENQLIVPVTDVQKALITKLTEPYVEDRTADAKGALEHVQQRPRRGLNVRQPEDMKTLVHQNRNELIVETPGTNHALLFVCLVTVVTVVALVAILKGGFFVTPIAIFVGGLASVVVIVSLVKDNYRLVISPRSWRLFNGKKLVSQGPASSLIGFEREESFKRGELLVLVTREYSFPFRIPVSEQETRFLTATLRAFLSSHS